MKRTLIILLAVVLALMSMSAGLVAAQDGGQGGGRGGDQGRPGDQRQDRFQPIDTVLDTIVAATGLSREEIIRLVTEENKTLAEVVTENGGDLDAVKASLVVTFTEQIEQQITGAQDRLDGIEADVDDLLSGQLPRQQQGGGNQPGGNRPGDTRQNDLPREVLVLVQTIADATGMNIRDIYQQAQSGSTLSDIATASGGDLAVITTTATTSITDQINQAVTNGRLTQEEADDYLAELDLLLNTLMTTDFQTLRQQQVIETQVRRATYQAMADNLGMNLREMLEAKQAGQTINDFITANGGDVEAVKIATLEALQTGVDEAVANGRITQEQADELMSSAPAALDKVLNSTIPERPNKQQGEEQGGSGI